MVYSCTTINGTCSEDQTDSGECVICRKVKEKTNGTFTIKCFTCEIPYRICPECYNNRKENGTALTCPPRAPLPKK